MDNSFVSRLRMNNIYPTAGNNPFGPPDMNSGMGDFTALLNQLLMNNSTVSKREPFHLYDIHGTGMPGWGPPAGQLDNIAKQARAPMNVVEAKPEETKYQKDTLNFKKQELASKDELSQQKLAQTGDLGQQKIDVSREGLKAKTEQNKESNKMKEEQIKINDFKVKHPGMKFAIQKGGNFVAEDPLTGKVTDSGVSTGTLSDEDKIAATGAERLDQIAAQGANQLKNTELQGENQRDVQGMRGEQAITNIGARGEVQRGLLDTKGSQNLAEIAARAREQRNINAAKPSTGTTTTSEKVTPAKPNIFGSENPLFGGASEKKVITTTKKEPTVKASDTNSDKPPVGAKPGGKWVNTKYGRVYMEP